MIRSTWSLLLYSQMLSGDDLSPSLYQEMIGRNKSHRILTDNKRVKSINISAGRIGSYLGKRSAQPVPSVMCPVTLYWMLIDVELVVAPVIKQRVTVLVTGVFHFVDFALWRNHTARFRICERYNGCQWFWPRYWCLYMGSGPINLRPFPLASIEIFLGVGVGDGILVRIG